MTTPYTPPVDQLLKLGRPEEPWQDYLRLGITRDNLPELLRLLADDELRFAEAPPDLPEDGFLPEWYAQIHAWRALAQLKAEEAIPVILNIFHQIDDQDDDWLGEDAKLIFEQIGPAAIPSLSEYLFNAQNGTYARTSASGSLQKIASRYPETRAACVSAIARAVANYSEQDEGLNAFMIWDLTQLKAVEQIDLIEQAFAANCVDTFVAGDVEDIKIEMGLLTERITPKKRPLLFREPDLIDSKHRINQPAKPSSTKKDKNKRKQEKKSRKKNRKK
jgi:hypothetical protein